MKQHSRKIQVPPDSTLTEQDYEQFCREAHRLLARFPQYFAPTVNSGDLELLKCIKAAGHPVAIATGSTPGSVVPIVKEYGIEVDAVVTANDVKRGKPHPDLFLCAAERLGVAPEGCIVVEDSDAGIEAAKAAGMRAMRFYDRQ